MGIKQQPHHILKVALYAHRAKCAYCDIPLTYRQATFDHVIPRAAGGKRYYGNIVLACANCNQSKSDTILNEIGWNMLRDKHAFLSRHQMKRIQRRHRKKDNLGLGVITSLQEPIHEEKTT